MTYDKAKLELSADVDNDGTKEDGVFVMSGNTVVVESVEPSYTLGGAGQNVNSVVQGLLFGKEHRRQGWYIDLGAGEHIWEIQFTEWNGSNNTWGDGSSFPADATGTENPLEQMQVLNRYLKAGTADSISPATLHVGKYNDTEGDALSPASVAIAGLRITHAAEDYSTFTGQLTCVETERGEIAHDVLNWVPYFNP